MRVFKALFLSTALALPALVLPVLALPLAAPAFAEGVITVTGEASSVLHLM